MPLTVISHFYNEEALLPYWLQHHLTIFNHGIMIDYDSTDRSVDIIREMAPSWEIRKSRNRTFDCFAVDYEVMDIERSISGYKMVLNTTEFLVHSDLTRFLRKRERRTGYVGSLTTGLIMADRLIDAKRPLVPGFPLIMQRRFGYIEKNGPAEWPARSRLLHRAKDGNYTVPGRHGTRHRAKMDDNLFLCWYGWSPMAHVRQRKLQIQNRIPPEHLEQGYGIQHKLEENQLLQNYTEQEKLSRDLWVELPELRTHAEKLAAKMIKF